jgi:predicted DNA-binding transcriptional regulator AlpA
MRTDLRELRAKDVCKEIERSRKWLWEAIRKGLFPPPERRNTRYVYWTREIVDAWKATHELKTRRKPQKPARKTGVARQLAAAFRGKHVTTVATPMPIKVPSRNGLPDAHAATGNNANTCSQDEGVARPMIDEHAPLGNNTCVISRQKEGVPDEQ